MGRNPKDNITITQVAELAGVSRATVSRVMNGRATVAPEIADRVRSAAERLNYHPSNVARSLSLGRTHMVSVVVPDLGNPMFQQILRGTTQAAAKSGYRVLVAETSEDAAAEAGIVLEARLRCDALVLVSPRSSEAVLDKLLPQVQPAVVVNRLLPGVDVHPIWTDYAAGAYALAEHLAELGHRRICYLAGPPNSASNAARLDGLEQAQDRYPDLEIIRIGCGSALGDGYREAERAVGTGATATMAFNDLAALGLLARLRELDVSVPDQMSVTGMDDIDLARFASPSLTTAHVPQFRLGEYAWQQLHAVIEDRDAEPAPLTRPALVVRGSTAPPRPDPGAGRIDAPT